MCAASSHVAAVAVARGVAHPVDHAHAPWVRRCLVDAHAVGCRQQRKILAGHGGGERRSPRSRSRAAGSGVGRPPPVRSSGRHPAPRSARRPAALPPMPAAAPASLPASSATRPWIATSWKARLARIALVGEHQVEHRAGWQRGQVAAAIGERAVAQLQRQPQPGLDALRLLDQARRRAPAMA